MTRRFAKQGHKNIAVTDKFHPPYLWLTCSNLISDYLIKLEDLIEVCFVYNVTIITRNNSIYPRG